MSSRLATLLTCWVAGAALTSTRAGFAANARCGRRVQGRGRATRLLMEDITGVSVGGLRVRLSKWALISEEAPGSRGDEAPGGRRDAHEPS